MKKTVKIQKINNVNTRPQNTVITQIVGLNTLQLKLSVVLLEIVVVIQVRFFVIQRCDAVGNFKSGKMCFQYQPEISTSTELFMISVEIQYAEIPLEVLHISNVYSTEVIFLTLLQMYFIRLFRGIHAQLRAVSFLGTFAFYYCYPVTYVFCPNEYEVDPFCVKLPRPT